VTKRGLVDEIIKNRVRHRIGVLACMARKITFRSPKAGLEYLRWRCMVHWIRLLHRVQKRITLPARTASRVYVLCSLLNFWKSHSGSWKSGGLTLWVGALPVRFWRSGYLPLSIKPEGMLETRTRKAQHSLEPRSTYRRAKTSQRHIDCKVRGLLRQVKASKLRLHYPNTSSYRRRQGC